MESKYPKPCLKCDKVYCKDGGSNYQNCDQWLTWFRWWWKWFRVNIPKIPVNPKQNRPKFQYLHPDEIRRYLQYSPCTGCSSEKDCGTPCKAYLQWYNARMEITRKKVGL